MGAKTGIYLLTLAALAVNITTQDLLLIWANGSLLVMPTVKILNFTRLNHSLVIVARGPGYVVYATPLANAATQRVSTSVIPTSYTTTTRREVSQQYATTTTTVQTSSTAVSPEATPPMQVAQPGTSVPGAFDAWWHVAVAAALWLASLKRLGLLKALAEAAGTTTASIRKAADRMKV